jgi:hypothetical protein
MNVNGLINTYTIRLAGHAVPVTNNHGNTLPQYEVIVNQTGVVAYSGTREACEAYVAKHK